MTVLTKFEIRKEKEMKIFFFLYQRFVLYNPWDPKIPLSDGLDYPEVRGKENKGVLQLPWTFMTVSPWDAEAESDLNPGPERSFKITFMSNTKDISFCPLDMHLAITRFCLSEFLSLSLLLLF